VTRPVDDTWTPRQRELAKTTDPYAPQDCIIYFIMGRDPWYGLPGRDKPTIVLYIGETARDSIERILEHFRDKWWARDIRGYHILTDEATGEPKVFGCKADVWVEERRLVNLLEPPHNWEYNVSNQWLIKDGRGVYQELPPQPAWWPRPGHAPAPPRRRADVDAGLPAPKRKRERGPAAEAWLRKVRTLVWCAVGWAVVAVAGWIWVAVEGWVETPQDGAGTGALLATLLAIAIVKIRAKIRRKLRRLAKQLR
jgi:hypothetical protein